MPVFSLLHPRALTGHPGNGASILNPRRRPGHGKKDAAPDIEADQNPAHVIAGHDPQLGKANEAIKAQMVKIRHRGAERLAKGKISLLHAINWHVQAMILHEHGDLAGRRPRWATANLQTVWAA